MQEGGAFFGSSRGDQDRCLLWEPWASQAALEVYRFLCASVFPPEE
jgi:hypothetical protein